MNFLLPILLTSTFLFGDYDDDVDPELADQLARQTVAYTLADAYEQSWHRILDRSARQDPNGPLLQRFDGDLYGTYHLDLAAADIPLSTATIWTRQRTGARMSLHSLGGLELAQHWQLRTEIPTWDRGYLALSYDGRQDRLHDQHLLRLEVGHRNLGGSGFDLALRIHPKAFVADTDLELLAHRHFRHFGTFGMRLGFVDPLTNHVRSSNPDPDLSERQSDLPLAFSGYFQSVVILGFRAEFYGGLLSEQFRQITASQSPADDRQRRDQALLGSALIEWKVPLLTLRTGFALEAVHAETRWQYPDQPAANRSVDETTLVRRIYLVSQPLASLRLETSAAQTGRPQTRRREDEDDQTRADGEWLASLRALWMPTDRVGADFQLLRVTRTTSGSIGPDLSGQFNRLVTRLMLRLHRDLWTTVGAGWTVDDDRSFFDGAGLTLMWVPRQFRAPKPR